MAASVWLTDTPADIAGYRRAVIGSRGDCPSLVRAVTSTEAGPSSGVQATRSAGGTALAWITEPLSGIVLTAATWTAHLWAYESNAAANAALRLQILQFTNAEGNSVLDDTGSTTELTTTMADYNRTTAAATSRTLADGDRLVFKVLVDDASSSMATGYSVTLAYGGQTARAEGDSYLVCPDTIQPTQSVPQATYDAIRRILRQEAPGDVATDVLQNAELADALTAALATYTRARPRTAAAALSGDGTAYDLTLPAGWVWGLSRLLSVEYPAGDQTPTLLDADDVGVHESVLGVQPVRAVRFRSTPASGTDNIVVRYTTRHTHTDEGSTIPADDLDAVLSLAAAYGADTLAAWSARQSEPTIGAEVVTRDGVQKWRDVAAQLRKRYEAAVGGGLTAASGVRDWDTKDSLGRDRLLHPGRWR
ncbi:MAG: hypothetical protein VW405_00865 [Rhodospirillaceae bacterium]